VVSIIRKVGGESSIAGVRRKGLAGVEKPSQFSKIKKKIKTHTHTRTHATPVRHTRKKTSQLRSSTLPITMDDKEVGEIPHESVGVDL